MSIRTESFGDAKEVIAFLEDLAYAKRDYIFRGHTDSRHLLETSLSRFRIIPYDQWGTHIDGLINDFRVGLAKIGIVPFDSSDRHTWLEYARHHGVPTPCLDFTYSPYIALFFAFNNELEGIRYYKEIEGNEVVVYALNVRELAGAWARSLADSNAETEEYNRAVREFLYPLRTLFKHSFPTGILQFIPYPSKLNKRMQRQQGALLYDTLDYRKMGYDGFEEFIGGIKEGNGEAALIKMRISKQCLPRILERLELMGITGGMLYQDADGVAMDVINSYYYNPKTGYLRDIFFPR